MLGAGHVGLPTAAAFAHIGHEVVATDIDAEKLFALREGRVPFHESGLDELVEEGLASMTAMGTDLGRSAHSAHLAAAMARAGRFTDARDLIERSKALVVATGERLRLIEIVRAALPVSADGRIEYSARANAVRSSLKQQIRDHFLGVLKKKKKDRLAQFLAANAGDPLDQLIDAYVTPEGLAAIISDPAPLKNASSLSSLPGIEGAQPREIDWSKFHHAFFTSPRDFAVEESKTEIARSIPSFFMRLRSVLG